MTSILIMCRVTIVLIHNCAIWALWHKRFAVVTVIHERYVCYLFALKGYIPREWEQLF